MKFYGRKALIDRLTYGVRGANRPVVMLVGSALTAPETTGSAGVPSAQGIVELIRAEFTGERLADLDAELELASNRYQAAFDFLLASRGPHYVDRVVQSAVLSSRKEHGGGANPQSASRASANDDQCRTFEDDLQGWQLTRGVRALGELVSWQPELFGQAVLTTNFDPLIEIAARRAGGKPYRTMLDADGNLEQTLASGCHVVHLHGYWYGTGTLHIPRQLEQPRPLLRKSLANLLRTRTLVVMGYGGWDDVFTATLIELIQDPREKIEVVWTTRGHGNLLDERLMRALAPGVNRAGVTLYEDIDCHDVLAEIADYWRPAGSRPKPSFEEFGRSWQAARSSGGLSASTVAKDRQLLELHAYPALGERQINEIEPDEILSLVRDVSAKGTIETARRLRSTIVRIFRDAIKEGRCERNPAAGLPRELGDHRSEPYPALLDEAEIGQLVRNIDNYHGSAVVRFAMLVLLHTYVRPGELRHAQWSDLDLRERTWTVSATRMEKRWKHIVPLSDQVCRIFRELRELTGGEGVLFPGRSAGGTISDGTINRALRLMGYTKAEAAGHGFRRTAETILHASGEFSPDAIQMSLAHAPPQRLQGVYKATQYMDERIKMAQWYSDWLDRAATLRRTL